MRSDDEAIPEGLAALEAARYQAVELGNLVGAGQLARAALPGADVEARFHLDALIAWLDERLAATTADDGDPVVGEVGCLLVDVDGSGEAFVARFGVEPAPAAGQPLLPAGCGAAFQRAVAGAELAVLRLLGRRHRLEPRRALLEGKRLYLRGPRAAETFVADGGSIGGAAAVALFSLYTDTPVPAGTLVTGRVSTDGTIGAVSHVATKVCAALRERPDARVVLIPGDADQPADDDPRVVRVTTLEALIERVFGAEGLGARPASAVDIEGTVRKGLELYAKLNSYRAAEELLGLALEAIVARRRETGDDALHRRDEFLCRWRIGSALVHQGRVEEADRMLGQAGDLGEALWQAEELDPRDYLGFRGNLAVLLRDRYRYGEAEALLEQTLALQRSLRQGKRERARTLGNLGELLTITGDHDRAEALLERCREHLESTYPEELPRVLCYLGNLAARRRRLDEALAHYEQGLAKNDEVEHGRGANAAFLAYGQVRALIEAGEPARALERADAALAELPAHQVYPRQLLLAQRGLAALATAAVERGRADLRAAADLTHVRGSLLRFGISTALGELACHLLDDAPSTEGTREACRCALTLVEAARAVPGLDDPRDDDGRERSALLGDLEAAFCGAAVVPPARRIALLRRVIALFPY